MSYKTNAPAFAHLQPTITEACISRKTFHPFSGEKKPQVKLRSKNYSDKCGLGCNWPDSKYAIAYFFRRPAGWKFPIHSTLLYQLYRQYVDRGLLYMQLVYNSNENQWEKAVICFFTITYTPFTPPKTCITGFNWVEIRNGTEKLNFPKVSSSH